MTSDATTAPSSALPIRFVLMRPRNPENLGAAARAMRNFGFSDWAIVDPRTLDFSTARRVAVHAEDLLDRPRLTSSLDEAIEDCAFVVGTSSRQVRGKRRLTPEEWASQVVRLGNSTRVALVFGDEKSGLSNTEIDRCHALSCIPTLPEQPSVNLAQALLLYAYEARRAALAQEKARQAPVPPPMLATDDTLQRIAGLWRQAMLESGFLTPSSGERTAVRDVMSPLLRARLSKREGRLFEAVLRVLIKAMG
ncbi:MAG: RNA methyltransferase [Myxococcales bacterium]|jgi:TrmH family RNA methyltransferase|nr:RNA methyltransferase [Myxococcales bacterium]